jgi:hypothetical protein
MSRPYVLLVALVATPALAFFFIDWKAAVLILGSSMVFARATRTKEQGIRRLTMLALLINQLVIIHSLYHYESQVIGGLNLKMLEVPVDEASPKPFVSIVVFENPKWSHDSVMETLMSLQSHSSTILAKEIVVKSPADFNGAEGPIPIVAEYSEDTDFIVFVAPSVKVSPDWLNGLVREVIANDERLIVPVVTDGRGLEQAASMIGSTRGELVPLLVSETASKYVPVIPYFSVLGVSKKSLGFYAEIPRLLAEGRVIELSLRAWLCGSGVIFSRFTKVSITQPHITDWKSLEGLEVDEKIVGCSHNIDWFYDKFKTEDADASIHQFRIRNGESCLSSTSERMLSVAPSCEEDNANQVFEQRGEEIRAVGIEGAICFDAGSASSPGKSPILYQCMPGNRNQFFYFYEGRFMWGSFCVTDEGGKVTLSDCSGLGDTLAANQRWSQEVITRNAD